MIFNLAFSILLVYGLLEHVVTLHLAGVEHANLKIIEGFNFKLAAC